MSPETVFAALDTAENRVVRSVGRAIRRFLSRAMTMDTLGEMYGWWGQQVDAEVATGIRETWVVAYQTYAGGAISTSSLDGLDIYMTKVKDRLVRGLDPPLPEAAFDLVRQAVVYGAGHGWSRGDVAQQIAASLDWEKNGLYWRGVKAETDEEIDVTLDKLGPPGTPSREWARLNDPSIQVLRDQRNLATKHLDAERSYWQDRAITIARTESTGAFNAAALSALHDEGWAYKEWLATEDTRTRKSHDDANGQTVRLNSPFHVGTTLLMIPGDPTGQADEVINCRCGILGSDSLTAAVGFNPRQARVPKGNGELSGRWIDMPGTILDKLLSAFPDSSEVREASNLLEGVDVWSSFDKVNAAADKVEKVDSSAAAELRDFGSVDWFSDPEFDPTMAGTVDNPIDVQGDLDQAVRLLAEGKHIRLNRVDEVGTLLDKLTAIVDEARAAGKDAETYDLCLVSSPGTNLFCQESKGVPRVEMPQLGGVEQGFRDRLEETGVSIEAKTVKAESLKASQGQLDGPHVAGMVAAMEVGKIPDDTIFVTRDGYIIDGHHRWASKVAIDAKDNQLGDIEMPVEMIDMEIGEALAAANKFAEEQGIKPKDIG